MILTITTNPTVDIYYQLSDFNIGELNRTNHVTKTAAGKGVNVGKVLGTLGADVAQTGFLGGVLGEYISREIKNHKQDDRFVRISGETRNCVGITHNNSITEINEAGPTILTSEQEEFLDNLEQISRDCTTIAISGSLALGLASDFYEKIIKFAKDKQKFIALDTSGQTLKNIIHSEYQPDLIKPNENEIKYLLGPTYKREDLPKILTKPPFDKIDTIIVSLGKEGSISKIAGKIYQAKVPQIKAINPIGSGDSALAGALYAIDRNLDDISIIKYSMTCGVLNALEAKTASVDMAKFDRYYGDVVVEEIINK